MSRRTQQQLVNQRLTNIRNNKARKGFKWGFSDKTGWDWLDLIAKLAVLLILGIATLLFSIQQANLAQQQRLEDQASVLDQQRQATFVKYQDDMRDLLLNRGLLTSKPSDEIRVIASTETITAMRQLDAQRNSFLVQFLQDTHLIGKDPHTNVRYNIVNFLYADLSVIDFSYANFFGADLDGANFSDTILTSADLSAATFKGTILYKTILSNAILTSADLRGAMFFEGVNLDGADLSGANLSGVDLDGANVHNATFKEANLSNTILRDAHNLTQQQLDSVFTCKGAILPEGLTCHRLSNPYE